MAIETPLWMQTEAYPARLDRQLIAALLSEGRLAGFTVSQRAGGANFSVDVSAGLAVVDGDDEAGQGAYLVTSTAVENITISAAPGSNSRYDLLVLQVNDSNAGGASSDDATIEVIEGTASSSPVVPSVPASALHLATIGPITSATAAITDALISTPSNRATLAHDIVTNATSTRVGSSSGTAGTIVRLDANQRASVGYPLTEYQIANRGYVLARMADANSAASSALSAAVAVASGSSGIVRWRKALGLVTVWTHTASGGNLNGVTIPAGFRPAASVVVPAMYADGSVTGISISTSGGITYRDPLSGNWTAATGAWDFVASYAAA